MAKALGFLALGAAFAYFLYLLSPKVCHPRTLQEWAEAETSSCLEASYVCENATLVSIGKGAIDYRLIAAGRGHEEVAVIMGLTQRLRMKFSCPPDPSFPSK
jgi:hypothetical protein